MTEDDNGDDWQGVFTHDAVVSVESVQQDALGRDWCEVRYLYGADGKLIWTGYSGDIYSSRTMHAIGWVLRHTYPYMIVDTGYEDSDVWSRVAGQFAIREVVKQLEGDW